MALPLPPPPPIAFPLFPPPSSTSFPLPPSIRLPFAFPLHSFHLHLRRSPPSSSPRPSSRIRMGLKIVHDYDSSFQLKPECQDSLHRLLSSSTFCSQVAAQCDKISSTYEFTGKLFQPVPWSVTTKHGMPQAFEKYFDNPDYAIINVPPNFMFQAKIFNPSRLCAIYRKVEKKNLNT